MAGQDLSPVQVSCKLIYQVSTFLGNVNTPQPVACRANASQGAP
jgi:hypothetical protein